LSQELLGYTHVYEAAARADAPTLLLLHGTGGNEHDLLPVRPMIAPDAGVLSPRGKVLENGMPRFFRRLAEGVFDVEDLKNRTVELGGFIAAAAERYKFDAGRIYAIGFSNGANIAASLLLMKPGVLAGAILFRGMVPFTPTATPDLRGTSVLLSSGTNDPYVPRENAERLASLLREGGAEVSHLWHERGHDLSPRDLAAARDWFAAVHG
jgi:phospholipase/carboxylesterase/glyoxalase family protein